MKALRNIIIGTLIFFFCSDTNLVYGQESELINLKSDSLYFESPALFTCNIQIPEDYNPDKEDLNGYFVK